MSAPVREEGAREAGTGWTPVLSLLLGPTHRLLGVEAQVSAACDIRLLTPLGFVAWSATASGAGTLGTVMDAAFGHYRLEIKAASGSIQATAALTAR